MERVNSSQYVDFELIFPLLGGQAEIMNNLGKVYIENEDNLEQIR